MNNRLIIISYRYWLESRTRFIISLVLLLAVTWYIIHGADRVIKQFLVVRPSEAFPFTKYIWFLLYKGYLLTLYTFCTFVLGLGGIMQEKQAGSATFALSLPLKRKEVVRAKISIASCEVFALAMLSTLAIVLFSRAYNHVYPWQHAITFGILMTAGGLVFMMLGICLSLFISRELVLPTTGLAIIGAVFFLTKLPALKTLNIFNLMCGAGYLSNETFLFIRPFNWQGTLACILISLLAEIFSEQVVRRKDF